MADSISDLSGYISTPGYPTTMSIQQKEIDCSVTLRLKSEFKIKIFIVDSTIITQTHNSSEPQCHFKLVISEGPPGATAIATSQICLQKIYLRNEMIFGLKGIVQQIA